VMAWVGRKTSEALHLLETAVSILRVATKQLSSPSYERRAKVAEGAGVGWTIGTGEPMGCMIYRLVPLAQARRFLRGGP